MVGGPLDSEIANGSSDGKRKSCKNNQTQGKLEKENG